MTANTSLGTALVTGASSGIGAVYADRLARRGYQLVLVARDHTRLEALAERLRSQTGVRVEVLAADLNAPAELALVEQRLRTDSAISLLVNNAGVASMGPLVSSDIASVDKMLQLNVVALTRLAAAALAGFVPRGKGILVNIGSVVSLAPETFNASYAASKAYVLSLSQSLQAEAGPSGVQVQAVLPGATRTEIWDRAGFSVDQLPAEIVMDTDKLVDAALLGMDRQERVTIPSLPNAADWDAFMAARAALGPNLSHSQPAPRYRA